jgi:hypothetical protein
VHPDPATRNKIFLSHGFDRAFVMTMFTAPVSSKAFSKRKTVSCSLKDR